MVPTKYYSNDNTYFAYYRKLLNEIFFKVNNSYVRIISNKIFFNVHMVPVKYFSVK